MAAPEFTPPSGKIPSQRMRNFFFALLGGTAAFSSSVIFWFVYFFQTFSIPVSEEVRIESALIITIFIHVAVILVFYRRTIIAEFRRVSARVEDTNCEGNGQLPRHK
jgi:heme/copper-type cytochrome/quinol oxidase subunit 2